MTKLRHQRSVNLYRRSIPMTLSGVSSANYIHQRVDPTRKANVGPCLFPPIRILKKAHSSESCYSGILSRTGPTIPFNFTITIPPGGPNDRAAHLFLDPREPYIPRDNRRVSEFIALHELREFHRLVKDKCDKVLAELRTYMNVHVS